MPGPAYFVPGAGNIAPPQFLPMVRYNSGFQPPGLPQQLHHVPPAGHIPPVGPVLPPAHGTVGPFPPVQTFDHMPVQLSHTANHNSVNAHPALSTTYSTGQLAAAPLLTNSTWSTSIQDLENSPQSLAETMGSEGDKIKAELFRTFGLLIKEHGPLEATNEKVLNIFIKLTVLERKIIMAQGSIKAFLGKCEYIRVQGNTLEVTGEVPQASNQSPIRRTNSRESDESDSLPMVDNLSSMEDKGENMPSDYMKSYSVPKLTSDLAPGLFSESKTVQSSSFKGFTSGSSLFSSTSSYLDVSSPEFVPKSVPLPAKSKFMNSIPDLEPHNVTTLESLGVSGFQEGGGNNKVNGQLHAEALPFCPSEKKAKSDLSDLYTARGDRRESGDAIQFGTPERTPNAKISSHDFSSQTCFEKVDRAEQTDASLWRPPESPGDRISQRKYDQTIERARIAEEHVIDLQRKLCRQALTGLRQEVLENYIRIVKTPNRSEGEKISLQKDYSSVMRQLQGEVDRVEILYDSNLSALRDGLELKALPSINFTDPTIPKSLTSNPHTSFGSNSGIHGSSHTPPSQIDLTAKLSEEPRRNSLVGKLRNRQYSETSSILSQDSGLDSSKKPPGLDNLQELKLKGKDLNPEAATNSRDCGELCGDRPQSQSSSDHSAQPEVLPQQLAMPGLPPVMPGVGLIPGIVPAGMTPEAMQQMMMMMHQKMVQMPQNPAFFLPNALPAMIPIHHANQPPVGPVSSLGDPVNSVPEKKPETDKPEEFFPQAHELNLEAMQVLPKKPDQIEDTTPEEVKSEIDTTKSADVNSNLYHWPKSVISDSPCAENSLFPGVSPGPGSINPQIPANTDTAAWRSGNGPEEDWTDNMTDGSDSQGGHLDRSAPHVSPGHMVQRSHPPPPQPQMSPGQQPGHNSHHAKQQVSRWMPTDSEPSRGSPPVPSSLLSPGIPTGTRKPLPILQSSIPTVAANIVQPGPPKGYSKAEPVKAPESATAAEEIPSDVIQEKNREVDATNPLLDRRRVPPQLLNDGSVSGISEIRMQDDVAIWEGGWESIPEGETEEWKHVTKKKLKAPEEPAQTVNHTQSPAHQTTSNFERLLQKIKDSYPKLTRQDVIHVVNEVRENRGGLKGVSMAQILEEAGGIIRNMKTVKASSSTTDVSADQSSNVLYKTSICAFWQQGMCTKKSKECVYAHGKKDLRALPKNTMCNNIVTKGTCPYGEKCIYAHSKEEMKKAH